MTKQELEQERQELIKAHEQFKARNLKLDMSRGKPSTAQLDLSSDMLDVVTSKKNYHSEHGTDCRNYGDVAGVDEAKRMLGDMVGVPADQVIVYGNSSLAIMYDFVCRALLKGVLGSTPWCKLDSVKFLCPVPGYDRHFTITEYFGIEMINIPMTPTGPDMDLVEQYVNNDPAVKGIWCVPKYSNPQGITYSDETVRRFAALKPAAEDFRIYWDNAYCVHHLYDDVQDELLEILSECEKAGNPDMVYEFFSTSKVTFAGAGISGVAASKRNLEEIRNQMSVEIISYDKLNMLRHAKYLVDQDGIRAKMKQHAQLMRPKFDLVLNTLANDLRPLGIADWIEPRGGYFVAFEAMEGCATRIIALAKEAGVVMTPAGAPYPYHKDPKDSVIRIAPSLPPLEELEVAMQVFVVCVKLASVEKILESK
jgi:DNA-binding transcriptional MocR family regulator